ncbi:MAG: sulfotransferase family protein [Pseudomonadota bacterium]
MTALDGGLDRLAIEKHLGTSFASVNYLTHIDRKRKFAYVETPKVACTSIKKFLMDQVVDGCFHLENKNQVHNREISPLTQLSELDMASAIEVWSSKFRRFSFVRNPFSRLLSGFLDKLITNEYERQRHLPMMGFEPGYVPTLLEFLERLAQKSDSDRDIHFRTQSELLMLAHVDYDFIGRFERFDRDFLWLQQAFYGIDHPNDSYENFGKHHASDANSKIEQYFGDREAQLVHDIYGTDFANFDYPIDIKKASEQQLPVRVGMLGKWL